MSPGLRSLQHSRLSGREASRRLDALAHSLQRNAPQRRLHREAVPVHVQSPDRGLCPAENKPQGGNPRLPAGRIVSAIQRFGPLGKWRGNRKRGRLERVGLVEQLQCLVRRWTTVPGANLRQERLRGSQQNGARLQYTALQR
uniref:(northern house mosquito) hypothetical protein n=1 Tax=Culex pipiens TaxID=7175 RepID=A0A8D8DPR2_CULPI